MTALRLHCTQFLRKRLCVTRSCVQATSSCTNVMVTPDDPEKLGALRSVDGVVEAYEHARVVFDRDANQTFLDERKLFDASDNECGLCAP